MKDRLALWLWLTEVFGVANPRKWEATARFDTIDECYDAFTHGDFYGLDNSEIHNIKSFDFDSVNRTLEYCDKNNINIYCYESEGFPDRLKEIYNPPSVFYAKTQLENLDFLDDNVCVAVVGSRNVTDYYAEVTRLITSQLVEAGVIINSGFAVGVDTIAHKTALENSGKTVAVLGTGIDRDYPPKTMEFKEQIAENGVVLSEFSPLEQGKQTYFKARNRILSALSLGVVVTQAGKSSGALNTVANAVSQGRDIFCVPPCDIFDERFEGVIELMRDGAIPVFDGRDVIYEYYENYSHKINVSKNLQNYTIKTEDSMLFAPKAKPKTSSPKSPKVIKEQKEEISVKQTPVEVDTSGLTQSQIKIVEALKGKQLLADEIARETQLDVMELFGEITELEIIGVIKSLPGNRYSL